MNTNKYNFYSPGIAIDSIFARMVSHLSSSYWTEKFNLRAERRVITCVQILSYWTKLLREEVYDAVGGLEKSQNIWGKKKTQLCWYCRKGRNSLHCHNFAKEFVPMKRSQESSSLNFLWRWKQAHIVSSRGTAYLWDNILQVTLKIRWVRDTLKCEPGKKEVWTPNVVLISDFRESRVTYGSEDSGDLSLRDACLGKPRSMNKKIFHPKQCWSQMQRRQWKRNERRSWRRHKNKM